MNGDQIKAIRQNLGMSQAELAAALYLQGPNGPRKVREWEADESPITGPAQKALELMAVAGGLRMALQNGRRT